MKFRLVTISTILSGVLLTGCATQAQPQPQPQLPKENPLLVSLAHSANQIESSVKELKMLNAAVNAPKLTAEQAKQYTQAQAYVPAEFKKIVTVPSYEGTPEKLLQAVANSINWDFKTYGQRPAMNEIIAKQYKETSLIDIVKDVGYSINSGDVVLNEKEKQIILKYKQ